MHNISTIYRFFTPFLDVDKEKKNLGGVMKKIEKSLVFDGIKFTKTTINNNLYFKITLEFEEKMGKIDFYYIKSLKKDMYFLPIFKCDIYLNNKFLLNNITKKRTISFLNNIFECFDGLNEKEYLIDLDNTMYYEFGFFKSKKRANYDFSNLETIRKKFENKDGIKLLENFINHFQKGDFILTADNSHKYHSFYGMLIYFLYLVYIMHLNINKTAEVLKELEDLGDNISNNSHIKLMKIRLKYVDDLSLVNYKNYKQKLELFFNLLD